MCSCSCGFEPVSDSSFSPRLPCHTFIAFPKNNSKNVTFFEVNLHFLTSKCVDPHWPWPLILGLVLHHLSFHSQWPPDSWLGSFNTLVIASDCAVVKAVVWIYTWLLNLLLEKVYTEKALATLPAHTGLSMDENRSSSRPASSQCHSPPVGPWRNMVEYFKKLIKNSVSTKFRAWVKDYCKRNGLLTLSVLAVMSGCVVGFGLRSLNLSTQVTCHLKLQICYRLYKEKTVLYYINKLCFFPT